MAKSSVDRTRKLEKLMAAKCRVVSDNVSEELSYYEVLK